MKFNFMSVRWHCGMGNCFILSPLVGDSAIAVALKDPGRGIEMAIHDMQV
jgi:hypothetical protein